MGKHDQSSAAVEGARRATGGAAGRSRGGRFSVGRKSEAVRRLLRGEDLESVSRELGVTAARVSAVARSVSGRGPGGAEEPRDGCPGRGQPSAAGQDRRAADGERAPVREGGSTGGGLPFGPEEVDAMRGAHSISTRRAYGVQRICRVWERARSSVYAKRHATRSRATRRRRGPVGAAPDEVLVGHIRRVLDASPFHGEGYRKAWAKLRVEGVRTSKERVRRLMREHDLQAPHRAGHAHGPTAHDGTITTAAPDVMWGTDMTATVDRGRGGGLRLCGRRSLYDRVHRPPRGQEREPVRGPGADPPGRPRTLRRHRQRRRPRASSSSRPRVKLPGRRFSTGGRVFRYRELTELRAGTRRQWGRRALHPHVEGELLVGAELRDDRGAPPGLARVQAGRTTSSGCLRSTTIEVQPACDAISSGWTRQHRTEYLQTTVQES